jgi:hypothetical protein
MNEYVIFFYNNSKMLKEFNKNYFEVDKSGGK